MSGGNSIFLQFPPVPSEGKVTQFEQHGQLKSQTTESKHKLQNYPDVTISCENTRNAAHRENAKSAFLPHDETVWKRALHAWYEMGCTGVFEEIVNSQSEVPDWAGTLAKKTLTLLRLGNSLHGTLFPHLSDVTRARFKRSSRMSNEDMIDKFSPVGHWSKSPVRAFSWHPHTLKFAYALQDDSIKVHTSKSELVPILKHKLQKYIADLAWQPNSASVLAVACKSCILIWHVEPTSLATRPSTSSVQVLQQNNHAPVTCLSWDPSGRILLSSSPVDTAIMAWDVPMETCIPLRRVGGGGVSLLQWSPDGTKVFSSTPSHLFRVWETVRWTCEVWTKCTSRCKAACWSPKGDVLLFATENEPIIYSLSFATTMYDSKTVIGGSQSAVAAIDLSEVDIQTEDGALVKVGGLVQNLVWDDTGERLAVLLHDSKGHMCGYVALFRTKTSPVLDITPCGLVNGPMGNIPHAISFQPNYDKGALLTVVWSNGEVRYIPLYFIARDEVHVNLDYQQVSPMTNGQILSPIRM